MLPTISSLKHLLQSIKNNSHTKNSLSVITVHWDPETGYWCAHDQVESNIISYPITTSVQVCKTSNIRKLAHKIKFSLKKEVT